MKPFNSEDQWIAIQQKTFVNWANDQLTLSNRSVENLATDFCDGVRLVSLVEVLQFQKIGKVYSNPKGRIQALHNVSLALNAVKNDNVKLVNIGTDDVVGGNLKLILGLLWHLILRYQISTNKSRAPPKKLMLSWFQDAIPGLAITNFTTCWQDGIALHALLEYCKPGLSAGWRSLDHRDKVNNCKIAMQKAKEQLGVPRVVSAEDFASPELDELSAMTYLSYFIRKNSPGYYGTLNWVCRQLKTANISNLTTDWNDGSNLCALVHSLGGEVTGWPDVDVNDHVGTCQKGLNAAEQLGVVSILTASELADPNVDHLAVMAYIGKLQRVVPRKSKSEKLTLQLQATGPCMVNEKVSFSLVQGDTDVVKSKTQVKVQGASGKVPFQIEWLNDLVNCNFTPVYPGTYQIELKYDGVAITGSPFEVKVVNDYSKVKVKGIPNPCPVSSSFNIQIEPPFPVKVARVKLRNTNGQVTEIFLDRKGDQFTTNFKPSQTGLWTMIAIVDDVEMKSMTFQAYDVRKARISGPQKAIAHQVANVIVETGDCGSEVLEVRVDSERTDEKVDATIQRKGNTHQISFVPTAHCKYQITATIHGDPVEGSPFHVEAVDPMRVIVTGDGLVKGMVGAEAFFRVNASGLDGNIIATIDVEKYEIPVSRERLDKDIYEFAYVPTRAGLYNVHVFWNETLVKGSPFHVKVIDKNHVRLLDDMRELKDENHHLALTYSEPMTMTFDLTKAGPGTLKAEMLTPNGKLPLYVEQEPGKATVSLVAEDEGAHHIHIFWSDLPLDANPFLAYCPGPPLPVDHQKVTVEGQGKESARTTIPAEFVINGRRAGPGVPEVVLQGINSNLSVEIVPLKYDRYRCIYTASVPGGYLLYVSWSDQIIPGCPMKVNVTPKGDPKKVRVHGEGLRGGFINQELYVYVDTSNTGPGDVTVSCQVQQQNEACHILEHKPGEYVVCFSPSLAEKHTLFVKYDGIDVTGSPFIIRINEPPDPQKVHVFGPGIEDGLIDMFESRFLVDTHGAGSGQLAVKIKGPRGGFRVDMTQETRTERNITCRYDPSETGEYLIQVRWSGIHVPGSPFHVYLVDTQEELNQVLLSKGLSIRPISDTWRAEI